MCEHEFIQEEWIVEVCKKCGKLQQEIDLEQQLASVNARVAELEGQVKQLHYCLIKDGEYIGEYQAQNKRMRTAINRYVLGNIELLDVLKAALEEKP